MTPKEKAAAKRDELLKELAELHITNATGTETIAPLTGEEDNKKLAALLKAAKAEAKAAAKRDTFNEPPSVAVGVYDGDGKLIRVYSLADHGEDYRSLAEQFVTSPKRKGFTTKPTQIELVKKPEPKETEFVKVIHPSGDVVRVYSLSQHGKEYRELADQFVAKYAVRKYKLSDN